MCKSEQDCLVQRGSEKVKSSATLMLHSHIQAPVLHTLDLWHFVNVKGWDCVRLLLSTRAQCHRSTIQRCTSKS